MNTAIVMHGRKAIKHVMRSSWIVIPLCGMVILAGCSSPMSSKDRATYTDLLNAGDYHGAAVAAESAGQITPDGKTKNVVWSLNAGSALFNSGDMKTSISVLDTTEKLAQNDDLDRMRAAVDYRYTTYDGVMTNVYKAMAFLALGDRDNARVEFNRSEERQRRAEEHFQKEIAHAARHNKAADNPQFGQFMELAQQSKEYESATTHLSELAVYAPFENPFATYLAGVFFVAEGDYPKGIDRLKRASEVMGPQSPAAADLVWAEQNHKPVARSGKKAPAKADVPQVWVVFENGQSATYHEVRLVLPMITGAPMTLALPILVQNPPAYSSLRIQSQGAASQTLAAGSFDAVMASEFKRRRPTILAEAVAEVVLKNVASEAARQSGNQLLNIVATVAANVSTTDTRSWTGLPKEFQAVRLEAPADGHLAFSSFEGAPVGDVTLPIGQPCIVWVKAQHMGAHPAIQVFPL